MKAKEKAKELVDRFAHTNPVNIAFLNNEQLIKCIKQAKQCALIAVNEIISALVGLAPIKYWQEVKQEIEKL